MKVLLDTSVLVAALVESHPNHVQALPWVQRAKRTEIEGMIAAHSLAELYAVLTSLPVRPRILPETAWRLIQENLFSDFEIITLSKADYRAVLQTLAKNQISGGATYDALITRAAEKAQVDRLLTLNADDFRRVWPRIAPKVFIP
ncbi:PIN domain-containing protein [Candidatus Acetothermia bacterium]|nr:PIN domain-containing protein [Candidatus Acetothermia bacterium]